MHALVIEKSPGRDAPEKIDLIFASTVIGAGKFADVHLQDRNQPSRCLVVRRVSGDALLAVPCRDCSVLLNGRPLHSATRLRDDDRIQVGETVFRVLLSREAKKATPEGKTAGSTDTACKDTRGGQPAVPRDQRRKRLPVSIRAFLLSSCTIVSRFLGLAREIVAAAFFGAGAAMDAFQMAFTIPNLFRRVLGEMAVESTFLPTYKTYAANGKHEEAASLARTTFILLVSALAIGMAITAVFTPQIVRIMALGFTPQVARTTIILTRLMLPFAVIIGVAAFLGSILLAHEKFTAYALLPAMFSLGQVVAIFIFYRAWGIYALAIGVLLGGIAQMGAQLLVLNRLKKQNTPDCAPDFHHPGLRRVLRLMGPVLLTSAVDKGSELAKRFFASFLVAGSLASLSFAFRLIHLPFAAVGLALARAVFPAMSEFFARTELERYRDELERSLTLCAFVMLPAAAGMAVLARPVVETVFAHGAWGGENPYATGMTALALVFYAVGLPFMSGVSILIRGYHAMLETNAPLLAATRGLYINIVFSLILVVTPLGHAGLACATSLDYMFQLAVLLFGIRARLASRGLGWNLQRLATSLARNAAATAVMGATVWLAARALWPGVEASALLRCLTLVGLVVLGMASYTITSLVFRSPELSAARALISRKRARP